MRKRKRLPSGSVAVLVALRGLVDWRPGGDEVVGRRVTVGFEPGGMNAELPDVLRAQEWCRKVRVSDSSVTVWLLRSRCWFLLAEQVEAELTAGLLEAFEAPSGLPPAPSL